MEFFQLFPISVFFLFGLPGSRFRIRMQVLLPQSTVTNSKSLDDCFCFFYFSLTSRVNLRQTCPELNAKKSMNHSVNSHGTAPLTCVTCRFRRVAGSTELIRLQIEGPLFQRSFPGGARYGYEYEYIPETLKAFRKLLLSFRFIIWNFSTRCNVN
jgi:hypothetical protein